MEVVVLVMTGWKGNRVGRDEGLQGRTWRDGWWRRRRRRRAAAKDLCQTCQRLDGRRARKRRLEQGWPMVRTKRVDEAG